MVEYSDRISYRMPQVLGVSKKLVAYFGGCKQNMISIYIRWCSL